MTWVPKAVAKTPPKRADPTKAQGYVPPVDVKNPEWPASPGSPMGQSGSTWGDVTPNPTVNPPGTTGSSYRYFATDASAPGGGTIKTVYTPQANMVGSLDEYGRVVWTPDPNYQAPAAPAAPAGENEDFGTADDAGQDYGTSGPVKDYFSTPDTVAGTAFKETSWVPNKNARDVQEQVMQKMLTAGQDVEKFIPDYQQQQQKWLANMPELKDAELAPYYEDAKRRAQESIDAWSASKGVYGSSTAQQLGADEIARLEGLRAHEESQYDLQRAQEMREQSKVGLDWTKGEGDLWTTAEQQGIEGGQAAGTIAGQVQDEDLDRATQKIAMAIGVDTATVNKLVQGMGIMEKAEKLSADEKQKFYENVGTAVTAAYNNAMGLMQQMLEEGKDLTESQVSAIVAQATGQLGLSLQEQDQMTKSLMALIEGAKTLKGAK